MAQSTVDPDLDPNRRASEVETNSRAAKELGVQGAPRSEREQDAELARLEAKHGVSGESESPQRERRSARSGATQEQSEADFNPDKPLTWKDRAKGVIRDDKGRFQKFLENSDELREQVGDRPHQRAAEGEDETPGEETDLDGEGRDSDDRQQRMRTALRALRRDGWSDRELDALDDRAILRMGERRARNQLDVDSKLADRSRDRNSTARDRDRTRERGRSDEPARRDPRADDTLDALTELEELFVDAFADESLGRKASSLVAQLLESKRQPDERDSARDAVLNDLMQERMRARLGERFPKLKTDDDLWDRVSERAEAWHESGVERGIYPQGLRGIEQAFSESARALVGDPLSKQERETRRRVAEARSNGQMSHTMTADRSPFEGVKSRDQLDDMWLAARERNDTSAMRQIEAQYKSVPRSTR